MSTEVLPDELEKEILLLQQEVLVKRKLLDECRENLNKEINEHKETKSVINQFETENKQLRMQLEVSLAATQKLEDENSKNRELLVKYKVQVDSYLTEREDLVNRSYTMEVENNELKSEITDLKEQLKGHVAFQENYKARQLKTENLLNEILNKQEILNKEQTRLEAACKEGLKFAAKISEEAKFQAKFVQEANDGRIKMEEEMIRLMGALRELQDQKKVSHSKEDENLNYLEEWKSYQQETESRIEELLAENKRLLEELNFATSQIELLMSKY